MNKQILINIKLKKTETQIISKNEMMLTNNLSLSFIEFTDQILLKGKWLYICTCAWYMVGKYKGWSWPWCGVSVVPVSPKILSKKII